jgi:hypothetical protein
MTGRARRGGGRGWGAPGPKAGEAGGRPVGPPHRLRTTRGGGGRGGVAGWADRPAGPRAQGGWAKKGRRGRGEKRKNFPFLYLFSI